MNRAEGHVLIAADTTTRTFALLRCLKETAAIVEVVSVTKKPLTVERSDAEWPVFAIKAKMYRASGKYSKHLFRVKGL